MDLTQSAATTAAQVIPMLTLSVSAAYAWTSRVPKSIRRRRQVGQGLKQEEFIDLGAWLAVSVIYIAYVLGAVETTLICFDVTQGNSVAPNSAEYVRNVIQAGLLLLFILPAWTLIVQPVSMILGAVARARQHSKD